ncbi:hypothetical protein RAK27_02100 [Carnobacterium maltaromaticum]|uniref:Uncharacterized protein n=1 Tax=Carnobacterium maltaromaticum TaxID=2751 RepID=A0AAW9JQ60_CARML|nr:hypothetical protein [Carnobacterium maltaromaticum]MDZ5757449.1 hypothetical protein [Carnobacterium maltaromaticum]
MKIEENWNDCGVFIATIEVVRDKDNELKKISRVFSLKNCFSKKHATEIIFSNFPNIKEVVQIEYFENSLSLK